MTAIASRVMPGKKIADHSDLPTFRTSGLSFWIGLVIVVLALISGFATYVILTGLTSIVPTNDVVFLVLFINALAVTAMLGVIVWQMWGLWRAWFRQAAGSRLHVRIVALFSVIAVVPAIILAVFATISFSSALDSWFSGRTRSIVQNSLGVATAYVHEHGQVIRTDAVNMAKDLDTTLKGDRTRLQPVLLGAALLRDLDIAYVIDGKGTVLATGAEEPRIPYAPPGRDLIAQTNAGQVAMLLPGALPRVAAMAKLRSFPDAYLLIARLVNPKVIQHLQRTQEGVAEYRALDERRASVKFAYGLIYVAIALTLLLAAIWIGFWFAGRLVAPVRRLMSAAQRVSEGDLDVQVPVKRGEGDLRVLSNTFNHMTAQLRSQHQDLLSTNEQLTERRRFIEAVLSGVSAGVIGLDTQSRVTLVNPTAERLLGRSEATLSGELLADAMPELAHLLEGLADAPANTRLQDQIDIIIDGSERHFAVQLTRERVGDEDYGSVVTVDDITELVGAQRTAAWADVARRIAHEIKNPLTPIQLSAERLKRKYAHVITKDRDIFDKCTDTIIRQVGDVARMVDEFSSFARMPKPQMQEEDMRDVVRDPVFLFQMSQSDIYFDVELPPKGTRVVCDRRLLSQALTNLVKNASEAIQAISEDPDVDPDYRGRIAVTTRVHDGKVIITVTDNGCGLPKQNRGRLMEPYVTTRTKGTGLGLAIVKKIVEQHSGTLSLEDAPEVHAGQRGALLRIVMPIANDSTATTISEQKNSRTSSQPNDTEAASSHTSQRRSVEAIVTAPAGRAMTTSRE